jgi:sugar-specific transcriptional regulator TrmB
LNIREDEINTLVDLGLTRPQARIYLALLGSRGELRAITISKVSNVVRQEVYQILDELQELNLVAKIVAVPLKFKAVSIEEATFILLENRSKKTNELRKKAGTMVQKYKKYLATTNDEKKEAGFTMIGPNAKVVYAALQRDAKGSMVLLSSKKRLEKFFSEFSQIWLKNLKRGVQIRVITEEPENKGYYEGIAPLLVNEQNFKLRYVPFSPPTLFGCIDKKIVMVATDLESGLFEKPMLLSENIVIVNLAQNYFEMLWTMTEVKRAPTVPQNSRG